MQTIASSQSEMVLTGNDFLCRAPGLVPDLTFPILWWSFSAFRSLSVIYILKVNTFLYDLCFKSAHLKRYNLESKRMVLDYESTA